MSVHTITVTFGTPDKWASSRVACESLGQAMRNAVQCAGREHCSPLLSVLIEAGDHAPRLSCGTWVAAPQGGWPEATA